MVTLDSSASAADTRTDIEASIDAINSGKTSNHLDFENRIQIDSKRFMDGVCFSVRANITPVPTTDARDNYREPNLSINSYQERGQSVRNPINAYSKVGFGSIADRRSPNMNSVYICGSRSVNDPKRA